MNLNDFEFDITKQFVNDTMDVISFDPYSYTTIDESFNTDLTEEERQNVSTVPLKITTFPWNPKFEGLVFLMGKVDIKETDEDSASLSYNYTVLKNPNMLDLAVSNDEESKRTPDNELLDIFVGRMVESLLYRMSQDHDFLEEMERRTVIAKGE